MNTTPVCEFKGVGRFKETDKCPIRAEWHVLDKTAGRQGDYCRKHVQTAFMPGHTIVVTPARSYAKADGMGLTVGEAKVLRVCRVCGEKAGARTRPDGSTEAFVFGFGFESAHEDCMSEEAKEILDKSVKTMGPSCRSD